MFDNVCMRAVSVECWRVIGVYVRRMLCGVRCLLYVVCWMANVYGCVCGMAYVNVYVPCVYCVMP